LPEASEVTQLLRDAPHVGYSGSSLLRFLLSTFALVSVR
jgi:hypothetical protein